MRKESAMNGPNLQLLIVNCQLSISSLGAAQKKERRSCLRLLSMGIGRRNGRLWGIAQLVDAFGILRLERHVEMVTAVQPAAEIDQSAAFAAKRPVRPFLRPLAIQGAIADWATWFFHRRILIKTSLFFLSISSDSLPLRRRQVSRRLLRSQRRCRFFRRA